MYRTITTTTTADGNANTPPINIPGRLIGVAFTTLAGTSFPRLTWVNADGVPAAFPIGVDYGGDVPPGNHYRPIRHRMPAPATWMLYLFAAQGAPTTVTFVYLPNN